MPISANQLATVTEKIYPSADKVSLKLLEGPGNTGTTMTLFEALQRLEPCSYLAQVAKDEAYRIQKFPDPKSRPGPKNAKVSKYYKRGGRGKEIHFVTASCTAGFLRNRLMSAYKFLLEGTRVEIHLHPKSTKETDTVDWALLHRLHLRPDSILKAMPEGTTMLAVPCCTDMSFKRRVPKNVELSRSKLMWVMENLEALEHAGVSRTRNSIIRAARWPRERGDLNLGRSKSPKDAPENADLTPEIPLDKLLDEAPDGTPAKSNLMPDVAEQ